MWIIKGILLGAALFALGTLLFLIAALKSRATSAIGLSVITGLTVHNFLFWLAFAASLVIGCAIVGSWPK